MLQAEATILAQKPLIDIPDLQEMIAAAHRVTFINKDEAPVNEFMGDGQNSSLVELERHWKRGKNYYQSMAKVNINALAQAMQSYILLPEELTKRKETTLAIVKERLNWKKLLLRSGNCKQK